MGVDRRGEQPARGERARENRRRAMSPINREVGCWQTVQCQYLTWRWVCALWIECAETDRDEAIPSYVGKRFSFPERYILQESDISFYVFIASIIPLFPLSPLFFRSSSARRLLLPSLCSFVPLSSYEFSLPPRPRQISPLFYVKTFPLRSLFLSFFLFPFSFSLIGRAPFFPGPSFASSFLLLYIQVYANLPPPFSCPWYLVSFSQRGIPHEYHINLGCIRRNHRQHTPLLTVLMYALWGLQFNYNITYEYWWLSRHMSC